MEFTDYPIDDFCKDMASFNLSYMEPNDRNKMWVFWSKEEGQGEGGGDLGPVTETITNNNWENVQEYLKSLLCNAEDTSRENVVLIQFWAPTTTTTTTTTIGGRCVFTTSNQPFGIKRIERGVCEYRKHCTSLEFNVFQHEEEDANDFGSIIRRVFRSKVAESTEAFTTKDNLLRDCAHKCSLRGFMFLPFFKPSSRCCSGVLELINSSKGSFFSDDPYLLANFIFKEANFISPPSLELQEAYFISPPSLELQQSTEIEEIKKALQGVCTTLQLPLAQIWIPCCTSTAMAYVDSPAKLCHSPYLSCSNIFSSSISQNGNQFFRHRIESFNCRCQGHDFRTGQGIVGKALLYHKPCFCRDVIQLPYGEYPFSNTAHQSGLTGCFAICLHSTRTKNHDYVLEFFLPPWNTFSRDPQRYLELLLATVKKQLPGFKTSSLGEESCVEVCEISVNDDEPDSVIMSHTFSVKLVPESFVNEKETVQNEVVGETVIDSGSNILGLEENGIVVCHSEKTLFRRLLPMPESLQNENEVVQQLSHDEPTMEEAVRKNELNVGIVKKTNAAVTSSERIFSRAEASEREYRTTDITLTREDLTKHFGKKLADVAKILNVSRSTVKRACRLNNIDKWPLPRRNQVVRSGNEGIEGTYKGDPSCSDSPPTPATATSGISHKTSNSRQEQDVGTVTIKATHGGYTIRFQLPYLSRKSDLVEKVTTRLSLNEGFFNIQYQDEENEWVLIACDEDLEECIGIWKGKSIIKMLIQPITDQAP